MVLKISRIQGVSHGNYPHPPFFLERRCVSKSTKRLFKGTGKTMFKVVYAAECHSRNRKALGA
jgi:hypothetical protein